MKKSIDCAGLRVTRCRCRGQSCIVMTSSFFFLWLGLYALEVGILFPNKRYPLTFVLARHVVNTSIIGRSDINVAVSLK